MRTRVPLIVWLAILFLSTTGQDRTDPFDGFDSQIEQMMGRWEVPGMAVGVVKDGEIIYLKGFGHRDIEKKLEVTPQTLFAIGSVSKPFTALSVGMLVDEGKLEWDTPLMEYLPDFRLHDEYATLHATPRDLLAHRTGLPGHYMMIAATPFGREEIYRRLRYLEPTAELRETYQYNNLMYMTLGYLVGRRAGGTWEEFIAKRVFQPLGMKRSTFRGKGVTDLDDVALPYEEEDGEIVPIPFPTRAVAAPAGGIVSSAEEMIRWLGVYLDEGGPIVSPGVVKEMHTPQIPIRYVPEDILGPMEAYGLGWTIRPYRGHYLVHHGGWIDGYVCWVSLMPRDNIGVVVLSNRGHQLLPLYLHYHIYHRLLDLGDDWTGRIAPPGDDDEGRREPVPGAGPTHPLEDLAGIYEHPAYGRVAVRADGGGLRIVFNDETSATLEHIKHNIFRSKHDDGDFDNLPVRFPVSRLGDIESVAIELQAGVDDILFVRVFDEALSKDMGFLRKLAGRYEFQGVDITVELREGPKLVVQVPGEPEREMAPYSATSLKILGQERSRVEIRYDEQGRVVEAVVHRPDGSISARRVQ